MIRSIPIYVIALGSLIASYTSIAAESNNGIDYNIVGYGQLVVFVHGSNLDQRMWAPQVERFSNIFRVLTYDLRGLGLSKLPIQPYSDATDLAQLLEEIDAPSATLVGLSAGTQVALDFAARYPERVQKLVLVSPSINGYTPKVTPPYLADLIAALRQQNYNSANEVMLNSGLMTVPAEYEDLVYEMVTSSEQWTLPYNLVQQPPEPVISSLDQIDIPTLVMLGENDFSAITEMGRFLEQELPMAKLVVLRGGKHLLNLTNSLEFNSEVERFVIAGSR